MYKAAVPVSARGVSTPARRCVAETRDSVGSDGEVREEVGRSAAAEGQGDVVDCDMEYAWTC